MEKRLISSKELLIRYGISKSTLRKWVRELGFPLIAITDKKRYTLESDLRAWEESMKNIFPTTPSPNHQSLSSDELSR
jgi:predicted DNA-binding transcriptional regulator AlpA